MIAVLAIAAIGLMPSLVPFEIGTSHGDRTCIAAKDAWHRDRSPSQADLTEVSTALSRTLATASQPENLRDPDRVGALLAEQRTRQSTPGFQRAQRYIEWRNASGACVPEGRHRLIMSGVALAVLGLIVVGRLGMSFIAFRTKPG